MSTSVWLIETDITLSIRIAVGTGIIKHLHGIYVYTSVYVGSWVRIDRVGEQHTKFQFVHYDNVRSEIQDFKNCSVSNWISRFLKGCGLEDLKILKICKTSNCIKESDNHRQFAALESYWYCSPVEFYSPIGIFRPKFLRCESRSHAGI